MKFFTEDIKLGSMRSRWQAYGNTGSDVPQNRSNTSNPDIETAPPPSPEERQLHVYNTLREELLLNVETTLHQNTRGLAVIGVVIGYALRFGPKEIVGIVPVIFGYLLIRNAEAQAWMMTNARHIVEIERNLSFPGSAFRYESRRGGLLGKEHTGLLRLRDVPSIFRIFAALLAYLASAFIVTEVVWPSVQTVPAINGFELTRWRLRSVYIVLSVVMAAVGVSVLIYRWTLQRDVTNSESDN